jgi:coatomer subunit zeta
MTWRAALRGHGEKASGLQGAAVWLCVSCRLRTQAASLIGIPEDIPKVRAVLILDSSSGAKVIGKYFDSSMFEGVDAEVSAAMVCLLGALDGSETQGAFEKRLFKKARGSPAPEEAEVAMVDGLVCVYRSEGDVMVFVVGGSTENELLLEAVLGALLEALGKLLKKGVSKAHVSCHGVLS